MNTLLSTVSAGQSVRFFETIRNGQERIVRGTVVGPYLAAAGGTIIRRLDGVEVVYTDRTARDLQVIS